MNSKDQLFQLLTSNVDEWQFSDYAAAHSSGIRWWTGNGFSFFYVDSSLHGKPDIGFWNRLKLWKWINEAKRVQYINRISK